MSANNKWLLNWVTLSIVAFLVSFIGGLAYFYALALFYPMAQTFSFLKIPKVKMPWLWLIYIVYWILLLQYATTYKYSVIGILASSLLGQILLFFMFGSFGKFQWLLYNTAGLASLILTVYLMRDVRISNDAIEIILVIGISFVCAFLSGLGIKQSFLK